MNVEPNQSNTVLFTTTYRAMRRMLFTCDNCDHNFSIVLNAKKSKCLIFEPTRKANSFMNFINLKPVFLHIGGNAVEIVNQWAHLGHIIDNRSDHDADISFRRN